MDRRPPEPSAAKSTQLVTFDAILPATMAVRAEESGVRRISTDPLTLLVLSSISVRSVGFSARISIDCPLRQSSTAE
jgi:hypothetical protein